MLRNAVGQFNHDVLYKNVLYFFLFRILLINTRFFTIQFTLTKNRKKNSFVITNKVKFTI